MMLGELILYMKIQSQANKLKPKKNLVPKIKIVSCNLGTIFVLYRFWLFTYIKKNSDCYIKMKNY